MEIIKYVCTPAKLRLLNILNICQTTYQTPDEWKKAITIPIFKKDNKKGCNRYRGGSLLNSAYKIYA
jgi:hypothetical protein